MFWPILSQFAHIEMVNINLYVAQLKNKTKQNKTKSTMYPPGYSVNNVR